MNNRFISLSLMLCLIISLFGSLQLSADYVLPDSGIYLDRSESESISKNIDSLSQSDSIFIFGTYDYTFDFEHIISPYVIRSNESIDAYNREIVALGQYFVPALDLSNKFIGYAEIRSNNEGKWETVGGVVGDSYTKQYELLSGETLTDIGISYQSSVFITDPFFGDMAILTKVDGEEALFYCNGYIHDLPEGISFQSADSYLKTGAEKDRFIDSLVMTINGQGEPSEAGALEGDDDDMLAAEGTWETDEDEDTVYGEETKTEDPDSYETQGQYQNTPSEDHTLSEGAVDNPPTGIDFTVLPAVLAAGLAGALAALKTKTWGF